MLRRRLLAAFAALLLAGVGAVLVLGYASGADQRAMAGMRTVSVLVLTAPVAKGTHGEALRASVSTRSLPAKAVVPGRVTDLKQLAGKVATTDLLAGEQLLARRFAPPPPPARPGEVSIPAGKEQVSMQFEAQQVLGGNLTAGARVGVYVTKGTRTTRVLDHVLVSRVQGGLVAAPAPAPSSSPSAAASPGGAVIVTFALNSAEAQRLIAGTGHAWVSLQTAAPQSQSPAASATAGGNQ